MWISGLISFFFGGLQAFLLRKTLFSLTAGSWPKALLFLLIKLVLYAIALTLLVLLFVRYAVPCAVGYALGLPLMVSVLFVVQTLRGSQLKTGDDQKRNP